MSTAPACFVPGGTAAPDVPRQFTAAPGADCSPPVSGKRPEFMANLATRRDRPDRSDLCAGNRAGRTGRGRAGRHSRADDPVRRCGAVGASVGRQCNEPQAFRPRRVLAAVGQHAVRGARAVRDRERPLSPAVGVLPQLDPQRRRTRAVVQRPLVPALPPEGRAWPSSGQCRRQCGIDADSTFGPAPDGGGARIARFRPRGGDSRADLRWPASGCRGSGPGGGRADSNHPHGTPGGVR